MTDLQIVLAVILAVVVIAVLALALILVRRDLEAISTGLATLGGRAEGGRVQASASTRVGCEGDQRAVRDHPRRPAGDRTQGGSRR